MEIGRTIRILEVEPEPFELPDPLDAPAEDQPDLEPVPALVPAEVRYA
jgi:hypothetical protein